MKMVYNTLMVVLFVFAVQNISVLMAEGAKNVDEPKEQKGGVGKPKDGKAEEEEEDPIEFAERGIQTIKQGYIDKIKSTFKKDRIPDAKKLQEAILGFQLVDYDLIFKVEQICTTNESFRKIKGWENCDDVIAGLTDATIVKYSDVQNDVAGEPEDDLKKLEELLETEMRNVLTVVYTQSLGDLHCPMAKIGKPSNPNP
ncbi:uncharacterized protein LOC128995882 [Macrosteles quadrilineatus]|uniref:uncharacterized protein LOC128995882 n=1 Tax=Macrosteles quadrilineatus TaxID=74068 RepID=UPI0023E2C254|nr:uncharacterized protein LOC128995882 [Macrosteles quadrilineatus]